MSLMDIANQKQVKVNTVRQNCYVRDIRPVEDDTVNQSLCKKYSVLEKKQLPNGYIEEVVEKDYPITPESVKSYADSADYRNDPMQAIANAPKRVNLGDVTEVQKFIESDPQEAVRVFRDVAKQLEKFSAQKTVEPATKPAIEPAQGGAQQ